MKKKSFKPRVSDLIKFFEKRAPFKLAEDWDKVGLIAGSARAEVAGVIAAVNLGPESIELALKKKANVIVCHHPPIFKQIKKLTAQTHPWLFLAIQKNIHVIALHTNFDLASEKLNQILAEKLGVKWVGPLQEASSQNASLTNHLGKFITYVPEKHAAKVLQALWKAGAGKIGDYENCSFSLSGEGSFLAKSGAKPAVGKVGKLEKVLERRLEVIFPMKTMRKVVDAARQAHPYEEMAYEVYAIVQPEKEIGYGFVGEFKQEINFSKLLVSVKKAFQLTTLTVAGPGLDERKLSVSRLAFSPGAGSSFVSAAVAKGVNVYICGELGYHQILEARTRGLTVVMLGHSYSERFFVKTVFEWIQDWARETKIADSKVDKVFERIHDVV